MRLLNLKSVEELDEALKGDPDQDALNHMQNPDEEWIQQQVEAEGQRPPQLKRIPRSQMPPPSSGHLEPPPLKPLKAQRLRS